MPVKLHKNNVVSMHDNKSTEKLVTEVKGHFYDAQTAETRYNKHRLAAGQKLLELRRRVDGGKEGAVTWWDWYATKFTKSRRDADRVMKLARSDNPDEALEAERKANRESKYALRQTSVSQENQRLTDEIVREEENNTAAREGRSRAYDIVEEALTLVARMTTKQRKRFDAEYNSRYSKKIS